VFSYQLLLDGMFFLFVFSILCHSSPLGFHCVARHVSSGGGPSPPSSSSGGPGRPKMPNDESSGGGPKKYFERGFLSLLFFRCVQSELFKFPGEGGGFQGKGGLTPFSLRMRKRGLKFLPNIFFIGFHCCCPTRSRFLGRGIYPCFPVCPPSSLSPHGGPW